MVLGQALTGCAYPQQVQIGSEPLSRAPGAPYQALGARIGLDQREQALAHGLRSAGGEALLARADQLGGQPLGADLLGDLAQRHLAQRGEVLDAEEVVERGVDALERVDLAGAQALEQGLRVEVDQHYLIGARKDRVGNRLAHADAAQLGDVVVERLQVLDVDGGEDVDAGREHVLDVFVALGVLDARDVGVGQLVDQAELGSAAQDRRQVHLFELGLPIAHAPARNDRQALGELGGLGATVGLEQADHDVASVL